MWLRLARTSRLFRRRESGRNKVLSFSLFFEFVDPSNLLAFFFGEHERPGSWRLFFAWRRERHRVVNLDRDGLWHLVLIEVVVRLPDSKHLLVPPLCFRQLPDLDRASGHDRSLAFAFDAVLAELLRDLSPGGEEG
jgi:hypothetical protein